MKKFILKVVAYLVVIITTYLLLGFLGDGYTDPFYLRFTTKKQNSLVLGTSRAAQGIQPEILNSLLLDSVDKPLYNYAFTLLHSPYGETYYNAIDAKLNKKISNGLFIVSVDPWSISSRSDFDYEIETNKELGKISFYNCYPNYDYFMYAYPKSMFSLLFKKKDTNMFVHNDGWLEINVSMKAAEVIKRTMFKEKQYITNKEIYGFSEKRLFWLKKTISLLKKHGRVILVRIPTGHKILKIENSMFPDFDNLIERSFNGELYLNYKNLVDKYVYTDGNHLFKESGTEFTKQLAKDINNHIK
ncbi:hypothetical protein [Flavicella marina]|uniref:hypothetical protein n=1 Tax=Flavicella marina TaxID=1475951 RepID=UPI001264D449|nr:hypothetical protein [Flavicella marina]